VKHRASSAHRMDALDRHNGQTEKRTNRHANKQTDVSLCSFVCSSVCVLDGVWHITYRQQADGQTAIIQQTAWLDNKHHHHHHRTVPFIESCHSNLTLHCTLHYSNEKAGVILTWAGKYRKLLNRHSETMRDNSFENSWRRLLFVVALRCCYTSGSQSDRCYRKECRLRPHLCCHVSTYSSGLTLPLNFHVADAPTQPAAAKATVPTDDLPPRRHCVDCRVPTQSVMCRHR